MICVFGYMAFAALHAWPFVGTWKSEQNDAWHQVRKFFFVFRYVKGHSLVQLWRLSLDINSSTAVPNLSYVAPRCRCRWLSDCRATVPCELCHSTTMGTVPQYHGNCATAKQQQPQRGTVWLVSRLDEFN